MVMEGEIFIRIIPPLLHPTPLIFLTPLLFILPFLPQVLHPRGFSGQIYESHSHTVAYTGLLTKDENVKTASFKASLMI